MNVEIHIKLKETFAVVPAIIQRDDEGLFIGSDRFENSEFDYNEEEERLYSKDGKIQIQF